MSPLLQEKLESFRARHIRVVLNTNSNRTARCRRANYKKQWLILPCLAVNVFDRFLVYATGEMLDVPLAALDAPAAAL